MRSSSMINSILARLAQGPAVMIDRPPPPAAPKSGHHADRPCHPKVAGQTSVCMCWSGQSRQKTPEKLCPSVKVLATKDRQFRPGTLPGTDGPSGSANLRSVGVIRPLDPRLSVIALWSLSETRCLRHPPPTTGRPAYVLITCLPRAPYGPSGRGSAPSSGTSLKPAALRRQRQHLVDRSFVSA